MSMTAAELFEVVKDVPREAWPDALWYFPAITCGDKAVMNADGAWRERPNGQFVGDTTAEAAFVGSMTARLMQRDVFASKSRFEETYWTIDMNNLNQRLGNYRTLVAALAAACKEAA